ncbi:MAG: hypothetical protein FJY07_05450, partial [Bacteroidetes bacterium]|nr:hypothetical protein [Bacteroidota bacterium]
MDKKVIRIIIFLTFVSLVAALITQLFWVRDAWSLKEDQFNNNVKLSLKRIVTELMAYEMNEDVNLTTLNNQESEQGLQFFSLINPVVLDSLVKKEFDHILENGLYSF